MNKTEILKLNVENLDKVLEHADKLMDTHSSLVSMTKRIVETYNSMSKKEQKALGFVFRKSMSEIVKRSMSTIERLEKNNNQLKAKSYNLKQTDLEALFLK